MSKFNPKKDIPDLSGKVIIVTGGNAGLGAATVQAIALHNPACVYILCRRIESGQQLVASIHESNPKVNLKVLKCDLNSLASVKACAEQFNQENDRLDILVNNAGIALTAPELSENGYEQHFAVNHIAHAYLTQLLMPKLLQTQKLGQDVRIVSVSSVAGQKLTPNGGILLNQLKTVIPKVSSMNRYAQSKLANILFAKKLSQEYPNITSTSIHPGTVLSDIWGKATGASFMLTLIKPFISFFTVTTEEGAINQLWAACGDGVKTGTYYEPVAKTVKDSKYVNDQKLADELWGWTNKELEAFGSPGWPSAA